MNRKHLVSVAAVACSLIAAACSNDPEGNNINGLSNNTTSTNNVSTSTNSSNNGTTVTNNTNAGTTTALPMGMALAGSADFAVAGSNFHVLTTQSNDAVPFGSGDIGIARGVQWGYVLDRNDAQVQVLAQTDLSDAGIIDVSGAAPTNPNDATDAGGKAFISLYDAGEIAVANPDGSDWSQSRIDLAAYDDYDQNPEPGAMASDEGFVLVVLQRLQDFVGVEPSLLLVIDSTDDSIVGTVDLGVTNAQAGLRARGTSFAVGVTGDFGADDGGILELTRAAAGDYAVGAMLVDEATLGGDLLDFVFTSQTHGFAVITLPDFSSRLVEFEVGGAATQVEGIVAPGFGGLDLSADGRWLAVGDRDAAVQGFVILDLSATPTVATTISSVLAPSGFRFTR